MAFQVDTDPKTIIQEGDVQRLISVAQETGQTLVKRQLTSSQIRNVFGEVRTIEMNWDSDPGGSFRRAVLLQPKLAYAAARDTGRKADGVRELARILSPCIAVVQDAHDNDTRKLYFDRFVDFFEAILAYHKAAGGRSN